MNDSNTGIKVVNGVPTSDDPHLRRMMSAPLSLDLDVHEHYLDMTNVKRVRSLFSEAQWDAAFPERNPVYNYDDFLKAVAKFPAFCNESNMPNYDDDQTC